MNKFATGCNTGQFKSMSTQESQNTLVQKRQALAGRFLAAKGAGKTSTVLHTAAGKPFQVKAFCARYKMPRTDLTRLTGYSQRAIDKWAAGDEPGQAARKHLRELSRLVDQLAELMEPGYVGTWLKTPNDAFDGSTPMQVIERGESDRLWSMIYQLQTGGLV
jgi:hypothetical protein